MVVVGICVHEIQKVFRKNLTSLCLAVVKRAQLIDKYSISVFWFHVCCLVLIFLFIRYPVVHTDKQWLLRSNSIIISERACLTNQWNSTITIKRTKSWKFAMMATILNDQDSVFIHQPHSEYRLAKNPPFPFYSHKNKNSSFTIKLSFSGCHRTSNRKNIWWIQSIHPISNA